MLVSSQPKYYFKTVNANGFFADDKIIQFTKLLDSTNVAEFVVHYPQNKLLYSNLSRDVQTTDFVLNFKRLRFFPLARPKYSGETIFTTSLGCIAKFLNKGKSHIKKKSVFLLTGVLLRRVLLYSTFADMHLIVTRTPQYFQEILNQIHNPSKSLYNHPFLPNRIIDESHDRIQTFDFKYVSFIKTKSYGYIK